MYSFQNKFHPLPYNYIKRKEKLGVYTKIKIELEMFEKISMALNVVTMAVLETYGKLLIILPIRQ